MTEEKKDAQEVVQQLETSKLSDLWRKEDYWAIWLGFALVIAALAIFLPRDVP